MAEGKWHFLKGKYPDSPLGNMSVAGDRGFLDRVAERKAEYAGLEQRELVNAFVDVRKEKDELEARIKELNAASEALGQLLKERFEAQEMRSVKTEGGQLLYLNIEPYVGVADRAKFEGWVEARKELDYLWSVHPGTLGTMVKGLLEEGKDSELPEGIDVFLKTSVRMRKA